MSDNQWNAYQWFQHKLIHWLDEGLIALHDRLIQYACEKDLWRTPEQRVQERETE